MSQLEKEIAAMTQDKTKADALWKQLDFNSNGAVSLAGPLVVEFIKRAIS